MWERQAKRVSITKAKSCVCFWFFMFWAMHNLVIFVGVCLAFVVAQKNLCMPICLASILSNVPNSKSPSIVSLFQKRKKKKKDHCSTWNERCNTHCRQIQKRKEDGQPHLLLLSPLLFLLTSPLNPTPPKPSMWHIHNFCCRAMQIISWESLQTQRPNIHTGVPALKSMKKLNKKLVISHKY